MAVALINDQSRAALEGRLPEGLDVLWYTGDAQLLDLAAQAQIAWLDPSSASVAETFVARAERLEWLNVISSGVDWLPLDALSDRGVTVTNGAGLHASAVSEYVVMGMLSMAKGWRDVVRAQEKHEWLAEPPRKQELGGAKVLVMGAGEIGSRITAVLGVMGARVTTMRAHPREHDLSPEDYEAHLKEFDWVVIIVPSTPDTRGMIGARQFAAMKPGAILVNFARGTVIDQDALVDALNSGQVGGAFLDVTDPEPLPKDHPLWSMPQVSVSMHLSGRTQEHLLERGAKRFEANCRRFLDGGSLEHVVDLTHGY